MKAGDHRLAVIDRVSREHAPAEYVVGCACGDTSERGDLLAGLAWFRRHLGYALAQLRVAA